ncbi:hypothetical protein B296_00038100 [Ensete ventricosum]|uniref:DUF834 domain-containing protein n=1 Tax=Ensete ventricosum TaxID=4639 RepID=A0A426ZXI1_ENSVE|nr:hypothetical protein B296_00038100 [Ensete ventricosum]
MVVIMWGYGREVATVDVGEDAGAGKRQGKEEGSSEEDVGEETGSDKGATTLLVQVEKKASATATKAVWKHDRDRGKKKGNSASVSATVASDRWATRDGNNGALGRRLEREQGKKEIGSRDGRGIAVVAAKSAMTGKGNDTTGGGGRYDYEKEGSSEDSASDGCARVGCGNGSLMELRKRKQVAIGADGSNDNASDEGWI